MLLGNAAMVRGGWPVGPETSFVIPCFAPPRAWKRPLHTKAVLDYLGSTSGRPYPPYAGNSSTAISPSLELRPHAT